MTTVKISLMFVAALGVRAAFCQPATAAQMEGVKPQPGYGTLHMKTNLGSLKLLSGEGRVEIAFTGTILVSLPEGKTTVSGNLRKEYDGHDKTVYHGTGRLIFVGKFRGIQWFGKNMNAVWYGKGVARLFGEFDKDLNTGVFWYDNPKDLHNWYAGSATEADLPSPFAPPTNVQPRERGKAPPPMPGGKGS